MASEADPPTTTNANPIHIREKCVNPHSIPSPLINLRQFQREAIRIRNQFEQFVSGTATSQNNSTQSQSQSHQQQLQLQLQLQQQDIPNKFDPAALRARFPIPVPPKGTTALNYLLMPEPVTVLNPASTSTSGAGAATTTTAQSISSTSRSRGSSTSTHGSGGSSGIGTTGEIEEGIIAEADDDVDLNDNDLETNSNSSNIMEREDCQLFKKALEECPLQSVKPNILQAPPVRYKVPVYEKPMMDVPLNKDSLKAITTTDMNVPDTELILQVSLYHPRLQFRKRMADLVVLGTQTLTSIRDVFNCPCDFIVAENGTNTAGMMKNTPERKITPAFFLIEGVCYGDYRRHSVGDYEDAFTYWLRKKKLNPKDVHISHRSMEEMPFLDMTFKVDYPYMMVHQGSCEHMMFFHQVRLIDNDDVRLRSMYPITLRKVPLYLNTCYLCERKIAMVITLDDIHAAHNPCLWCNDCFNGFHGGMEMDENMTVFKYTYTADAQIYMETGQDLDNDDLDADD
ncbi:small nuclear RNA activating complex, polypeptide 3 [Blyttiomyces sp. JEL0837]|nr:small nuclear RNA activating complex, polypeptide 3 [Blyttiomyces sp. JEL0837]